MDGRDSEDKALNHVLHGYLWVCFSFSFFGLALWRTGMDIRNVIESSKFAHTRNEGLLVKMYFHSSE